MTVRRLCRTQSLSARDRNHLKRTHDRSVLGGAVRQRACPASRPLSSTAKANAAASTEASTHGAAKWTACIPRGRTTTAWHASSATCLAMTFTTSVILSARAARSTPTARTTRSMRFPSRDWMLCWLSGRTGIQSGMADGRTGAQGWAGARHDTLWTVLAVLMMESINEEKTLLLIPQY